MTNRQNMNRSQQVREIYVELRRSVGRQVCSGELLRCATDILELYEEQAETPKFDDRVGGIPFDEWALDLAFADGGWRVLGHEFRRRQAMAREESEELRMHCGLVRYRMGLE